MNTINIAPNITLSLSGLFSSRLLVQADSGGGKSYMLRLLAERIAPLRQFIVIDIEGEFSTLRSAVKDIVVIGGDSADVPLVTRTAKPLAEMIRERRFSAVLDLSDLSTTEQRQYVRDFLDGLISAPREHWHPCVVFVDEAHELAPESGKGDSCATEAVARLMKRGRKRNLAGVAATQRFSSLNKEVANLCRSNLCGPTAPMDTKRAAELMGIPPKDAADLATLDPGEWIGRGPAISRTAIRFTADLPQTRPPEPGVSDAAPASAGAIKKLASEIAKLSPPELPKDDTEALRAEIAKLRQELSQRPAEVDQRAIEASVAAAVAERDSYWTEKLDASLAPMKRARETFADLAKELGAAIGIMVERDAPPIPKPEIHSSNGHVHRGPAKMPVVIPTPHNPTAVNGNLPSLPKAERLILRAFYWLKDEEATPSKVAFYSGYTQGTGGFNNALGRLRSSGLIAGWRITPEGKAMMSGNVQPKPTGRDLREWLRPKLGKAENSILDALINAGGRRLSSAEIADASGYTMGTGGFNNALGRLRSLEAAEGYEREGGTKAADVFFAR